MKRILITICLLILMAGCDTNSSRMVPTSFEVINKHQCTVSINKITGGRKSNLLNPFETPQIPNSAFVEALSNALAKSGVFRAVIKGNGADYLLDVTILSYSQPLIGFGFDIDMKTKWELTDAKTFLSIWSNTFETTYNGKLFEAFIAVERLQKAKEGAARVNIKEGIRQLSLLNL